MKCPLPEKVIQNTFFVKMKKSVLNRKPGIIMAILVLSQCYLLYNLLNAVIIIAYNVMNFTIYINQGVYGIAHFLLFQLQHDLGLKCEALRCFFFPHKILSLELYGSEIYSRKHLNSHCLHLVYLHHLASVMILVCEFDVTCFKYLLNKLYAKIDFWVLTKHGGIAWGIASHIFCHYPFYFNAVTKTRVQSRMSHVCFSVERKMLSAEPQFPWWLKLQVVF